ncbi:hypothetical protein AU210_016420 [Fusarium oxysporum f. sp. radicis-cucumerinum]|uniref:Uncharacterized protein n=1 Tax=Fusarium oxysporum f. sp. radicis-cucumerinum TaxID=327505 RepID=A0A2H3G0M3_FUSOX|nr:hypothetical protein AU210_016724 [Fusarium oxysporum f. sp. radicis-cucumerinum]PCD21458.1 hypothetical protein AU210_016420 [Fusarium oxysporum f. sp. radicis-cucumerinum]
MQRKDVEDFFDLMSHDTSCTESCSSTPPGSESDVDYTDHNGDLVGFVEPDSPVRELSVPSSPQLRSKRRRVETRRRRRRAPALTIALSSSDVETTMTMSDETKGASGHALQLPLSEPLSKQLDYVQRVLGDMINLLQTTKVCAERAAVGDPEGLEAN